MLWLSRGLVAWKKCSVLQSVLLRFQYILENEITHAMGCLKKQFSHSSLLGPVLYLIVLLLKLLSVLGMHSPLTTGNIPVQREKRKKSKGFGDGPRFWVLIIPSSETSRWLFNPNSMFPYHHGPLMFVGWLTMCYICDVSNLNPHVK
jgi:hypothetical protein